jgi:hypothetical protein
VKGLDGLRASNESLLAQGRRKQAKASKELEVANAKNAEDEAEIARLAVIVNRKPTTDGDVCARADSILGSLIPDGVRD